VPAERFRELGLQRAETAAAVYASADFITVHLPRNKDTLGFVGDAAFAQMKDGVRVVNVARGGIVDEEALARALENGKVAAAAVDVYPKEPTTESVLFRYDNVVATPHLGASTREAQLRAGVQTAEQVVLALSGRFAPNAVNVPFSLGEEAEEIMPFVDVAEMLGKLVTQLADEPVDAFEISYEGAIAQYDTSILSMAVLQGALAGKVEDEVNFVNVADIAAARGLTWRESRQPAIVDYVSLITVTARDGAELTVAGTALGPRHRPRIVMAHGRDVDLEPREHMLFVRARAQIPGTFGKIGAKIGEYGINISQVSVGVTGRGQHEVMGLALDAAISDEQVAAVVAHAGLLDGRRVGL
jgi:D-3-phosphoglycerate dehydrogenase